MLNLIKLVTYLVKIWFLLKSFAKCTPESIEMINELEFKDIAKIVQKNIISFVYYLKTCYIP